MRHRSQDERTVDDSGGRVEAVVQLIASDQFVFVSGGFAEALPDKVTVLAESSERMEDIDVDRALRAKERAEKRIAKAQRQQQEVDRVRAEAALQRAVSRLKVAEMRPP